MAFKRPFKLIILGKFAALVAFITICGCASFNDGNLQHFGFDVLNTSDPEHPLDAQTIFPLKSREKTYRITQGKGSGKETIHSCKPTDKYNASWVNGQGKSRSEYWRLDENGSIMMTAAISYRDQAISFFEPPLTIITKTIKPGQTQQHETSMRVVDLKNPARQLEAGKAVITIHYVDDLLLSTPLGEILTKRVRIVFKADLRFANAVTTTTLYVSQDLGVIVKEQSESISWLGLPLSNDRKTLVLLPSLPTGSK